MVTSVLNTKALFESLDRSFAGFAQLIASLSNSQVNAIPFKNSWTSGQLTEHVARSVTGISKALNIEGKPAMRNPGEREDELKKIFLDFSVKFKSPEFILPTKNSYNKKTCISDLERAFLRLKEESNNTNLSEAINHPAFGEITKLELLFFTKFHTERHLHQLKQILTQLQNK